MENYNEHKVFGNGRGIPSVEVYCLNEKLHRIDGPAYIAYYDNGNLWYEFYYLNGKEHREEGPAYFQYDINRNLRVECYFIDGKMHRIDNPAQIFYNKSGKIYRRQYFILNYEVSKKDFYTPGFIDAFILEHS